MHRCGGTARTLEWMPLCRDRLMAVFSQGHQLAGEPAVTLEMLRGERLLLPQKGYGCEAHPVLERIPEESEVRFITCSEYVALSMVAAGLGGLRPAGAAAAALSGRDGVRSTETGAVPDARKWGSPPGCRVSRGSKTLWDMSGLMWKRRVKTARCLPRRQTPGRADDPKWMNFTEIVGMWGLGLLTGRKPTL